MLTRRAGCAAAPSGHVTNRAVDRDDVVGGTEAGAFQPGEHLVHETVSAVIAGGVDLRREVLEVEDHRAAEQAKRDRQEKVDVRRAGDLHDVDTTRASARSICAPGHGEGVEVLADEAELAAAFGRAG
jgi:hypothetical protein